MKIQTGIEVFDDPEYCDVVNDSPPCPHLDSEEQICTAFTTAGCYHKLIFDYDRAAFKKCSQCISAYQASEKEKK